MAARRLIRFDYKQSCRECQLSDHEMCTRVCTPRTQRSLQHAELTEHDCRSALHSVLLSRVSRVLGAAATKATKANAAKRGDLKNCIAVDVEV